MLLLVFNETDTYVHKYMCYVRNYFNNMYYENHKIKGTVGTVIKIFGLWPVTRMYAEQHIAES